MTVTLYISLALPLIIEEEVEVISFLIKQLIGEDIEKIADALLKFRSLPNAIEVGVRLNDMEMGIHGAGTILVLIRETHVGNRIPFTGQGFDITIVLGIKGMFLDVMIQGDGDIQRFLITCGTSILREAIDGKTDGIGLLLGIQRITLVIYAPVDAAIFLVQEMITDILLGAGGSLQILRFLQHTVGSRERPKNAGIHHSAFLGFRVYLVITIYTTVETAVFLIFHRVNPILEDVVLQDILHRFFQVFHFSSDYQLYIILLFDRELP